MVDEIDVFLRNTLQLGRNGIIIDNRLKMRGFDKTRVWRNVRFCRARRFDSRASVFKCRQNLGLGL